MLTLRSHVGRILQDLRVAAGLTQEDLARRMGWDSSKLVSDYETGRRNATLDTVERLFRALNIRDFAGASAFPQSKSSSDEQALLASFRKSDPSLRSLILSLARMIAGRGKKS